MAVFLGLLAAVGVSGCTGSSAPVAATASPPASHATAASSSTSRAATASAEAAPSPAASASAATSSATPGSSGAVKNLIVSPVVRSELLVAYAAFRKIPTSDMRGLPDSVYYAYQPATGTYWAKATYEPTSGDSLTVQVGFQDGGSDAFYKKTGSGPWEVTIGGEPEVCEELRFFPRQVLAAWALPISETPPAGC
jgi:hypothetical protein